MKHFFLIFSFIFITNNSYSQDNFTFDLFNASVTGPVLKVNDTQGEAIYSKSFSGPAATEFDLDDDGVNELLIIDSSKQANKPFYTLYIYNTIDSFYLADSVISGSSEPYQLQSDETEGIIIVTGNPEFERYNTDPENLFLPINCWKYEAGELFLVNDEVYDIFEIRIDELTEVLENIYSESKKECSTSRKVKSAIAAIFTDCINAGDKSIASQFVKNYYFCEDIEQFLQELNSLTKPEDNLSE
jgi:hypothetical protein